MAKQISKTVESAAVPNPLLEADPAPVLVDLVEHKASTVRWLEWLQRLAVATFGGETLIERVSRITGRAFPTNTRVLLSFTVDKPLTAQNVMRPCDFFPASMLHKRGKYTAVAAAVGAPVTDPKTTLGPRVSDGMNLILINPRLGAGLDAKAASLKHAEAFLYGVHMAVRGEPEAASNGTVRWWGGTFWRDHALIGFSDSDKADKWSAGTDLRNILSTLLFGGDNPVGEIPVGSILAEPVSNKNPTTAFRVVCPYDREDTRWKAISEIPKDERKAAIDDGRIHFIGRAHYQHNSEASLPWCHRSHGSGKAGKVPMQVVMLDTPEYGDAIVPYGAVPQGALKSPPKAETREIPDVSDLAPTGTDN